MARERAKGGKWTEIKKKTRRRGGSRFDKFGSVVSIYSGIAGGVSRRRDPGRRMTAREAW